MATQNKASRKPTKNPRPQRMAKSKAAAAGDIKTVTRTVRGKTETFTYHSPKAVMHGRVHRTYLRAGELVDKIRVSGLPRETLEQAQIARDALWSLRADIDKLPDDWRPDRAKLAPKDVVIFKAAVATDYAPLVNGRGPIRVAEVLGKLVRIFVGDGPIAETAIVPASHLELAPQAALKAAAAAKE